MSSADKIFAYLLIGGICVVNAGWTAERAAGSFSVATDGNRVTLSANNASLVEIVTEIGAQLGFDVVSFVERDERVTASFESVPLRDAISRLSGRYAAFAGTDGEIERLYLLRRGTQQSTTTINRSNTEQRNEPFKFQFDPAQHIKQ